MFMVAGEALIDLVPRPGGSGALAPLTPQLGGGPFNTAVALGRLGTEAAFCSRVSEDGFGAALLDELRAAGVDTTYVQRGAEPTTLAVATLTPEGSAGYTFYAQGTADRLFTVPDVLPGDLSALCFGTCSLVLEPGASAYEELLHNQARTGVFTLLDPNIRAALIPDPDAYRARFRSWLPSVSLLKLSEEDADWLGGDVAGWAEAGPSAVVLTRGAGGLSVRLRGGATYEVPGVPVEVVDTIGAGDTVNAALLHRLESHAALDAEAAVALGPAGWREVLGFAARAAALTCSRAGAQPPYAHELD